MKFLKITNDQGNIGRLQPDEFSKVTDKFPQWRRTVGSQYFRDWLYAQNSDIAKLAASENQNDAIKVLFLYSEHFRNNS